MLKTVKPLQVSPAIKATRWALLIYGIFYGAWKLQRLRVYDAKERVIREHNLREKHERMLIESKRKTIEDLTDLGRQLEITEFPPGWDKDL